MGTVFVGALKYPTWMSSPLHIAHFLNQKSISHEPTLEPVWSKLSVIEMNSRAVFLYKVLLSLICAWPITVFSNTTIATLIDTNSFRGTVPVYLEEILQPFS